MIKNISVSQITDAVYEAYDLFKDNSTGENARYIPYLANIPSDLFAISVCLPSGRLINVGNTDYVFGIESVSKVPTAILVMMQHGTKELLAKIGADATGLPFDSILAMLLEKEHPGTPLVNAGAISACSLVKPIGDEAGKWNSIVNHLTDLCGSSPHLIDELYRSESDTNYNNRAISWLLQVYNRIYDDPMMSLDLYTRQCSLGVTNEQMAIMSTTIAEGGRNPITGKQIFPKEFTPQIISLIASVGFYQKTGDWIFSSGIPAKSGVGGGIIGIMPGVFGIASFSPALDKAGNSVKAQLALQHVMKKLNLNIFHPTRAIVIE